MGAAKRALRAFHDWFYGLERRRRPPPRRVPLPEAMKILGLERLDAVDCGALRKKVAALIEANNPRQGGSAYIQAKLKGAFEAVVRAQGRGPT